MYIAFEIFNSKDTCSVWIAHFFNAQNQALGKAACWYEKVIGKFYFSNQVILNRLPSNTLFIQITKVHF